MTGIGQDVKALFKNQAVITDADKQLFTTPKK